MPARRIAEAPEVRLGVEDEAAVIGAMLYSRATRKRAVPMLRKSDFIDDKHKVLYEVASEMDRRNLRWSEDAVASIHSRREDWGGFEYLRMLIDEYGQDLPNLEYHVERIKLTGFKKHLLSKVATDLMELGENPKSTAEDVVQFGQRLVAKASTMASVRRYDGQQAALDTWDIFKVREKDTAERIGFVCPAMDSIFSFGLANGRCSVLGAAPGSGKTTFAVALMRRRIFEAGLGTCYIACEVSDQSEITLMMASAELRIPFLQLLHAKGLSNEDRVRLQTWLIDLHRRGKESHEIVLDPFTYEDDYRSDDGKRRLYAGDLNRKNLATLESIVAATVHDLVILDMVGHALIEEDVQLLNRGLLAIEKIAKRHNKHILLLHHLNRGDARVKNPRPTMKSFRGASGFENYMHNVMVCWRPRGSSRGEPSSDGKSDTFELSLAKQKVGCEAVVVYDYHPEFMDFTNGRIVHRGNDALAQAEDDGGQDFKL